MELQTNATEKNRLRRFGRDSSVKCKKSKPGSMSMMPRSRSEERCRVVPYPAGINARVQSSRCRVVMLLLSTSTRFDMKSSFVVFAINTSPEAFPDKEKASSAMANDCLLKRAVIVGFNAPRRQGRADVPMHAARPSCSQWCGPGTEAPAHRKDGTMQIPPKSRQPSTSSSSNSLSSEVHVHEWRLQANMLS